MINVTKLHNELVNANIPIHGVASDGRIDFQEQATAEQRTQCAAIVAAHDPIDHELATFQMDRSQLRTEYQATSAQLQQIEDAASPTNAQVIAAVKFLAKTLRLTLKLLARLL